MVDDAAEALLMLNPAYQEEVAYETFFGILQYFGIAV
ncbi:N-acetylmuramoyl-L-alanine amidase [Thalassobacillus pellis]|nr:N-acetylmuramoyl-L-alanine amidase [Thalassobacillus pellis]